MRNDVRHFAEQMSAMMDEKEREKGPINGGYSLQKALMNLEAQWNKMRETPTPQGEALRRILVHLANFAMIAEGKIGVDRRQGPVTSGSNRCPVVNANAVQCGLLVGHDGKHKLGESVEPW